MKRLIESKVWLAALLPVLAMGALSSRAAAQSEAGERITIMVPNLAPQNGADKKFGEKVADELRDKIGELHTHQTVSSKDIKNARKKYDLQDEDLYNCIKARQLAMQESWGLVLCGSYAPAANGQVQVSAQFVGATNGETFDVPAFSVSDREPKQAAQQILQTFDQWQTQLRHTVFCQQYMDSQNWDSALENCNKALAINPNSQSALYKKGYILWKQGSREEALEALKKDLELDPINQDALKLAGIVATEMGNQQEARGYFDRYMELNPGDIQVRLSIATDIANAGDYETALHYAEQGLQTDTTDNLTLVTYIGHFAANAAAQAEQGESPDSAKIEGFYRTAANAYEKVFDQQGAETDSLVLERLIIAKYKLGQTDEAIALGKRATVAAPDNARIWDAYSRALEDAGKTDEALAAINKAEQIEGASATYTQRKAMLWLRAGKSDRAVTALQSAVQSGDIKPEDAFRMIFANAYTQKFQKGQLDAAYSLLDAAGPLAQTEEDKLTRNFWRGYILYQQGQEVGKPMNAQAAKKAKPLFEHALQLFQAARGYEKIHASADVPKLIDATQRFIEIQDALIKRGK